MNRHRIAVVGMACQYPDASSPAELWQNVLARRRAFRRIPECRLSAGYRGGPDDLDLAYVTHAAVLRDWTFDRERFGVPGPLYRAADHAHWLALETAADALADAGFPGGDGLDRGTVGVVLGNSLTGEFTRASTIRLRWPFIAEAAATALDGAGASPSLTGDVLDRLERLVKQPFEVPGDETLAGALANTIAGRICNQFDFHGTGYTVDGACSSSLLAVMIACQALSAGDCDFILAGGVDMSLDPFELVGFSRLGALADAEMRVYDTRPTGFLPGEGCGVVALMRAKDAERLGARVYTHLVGWASSSDGAGGLTRPARDGQLLALRRAYRSAGLAPGQAQLIEGHGTGTAVGDQIELEALGLLRDGAPAPAALGTIKTNIGHTKSAAGVAGLIKATLAVRHRVLPPTTGCDTPHDLLRQSSTSLRVLREPEAWSDPTPRAGVSSMGFGGINVHLVIEGVDGTATPAPLGPEVRRWSARTGSHEIVVIGSNSATELAERLMTLSNLARQLSSAEVRDVAATAWHDDQGGQFRAALVARNPDELAEAASAAHEAVMDWDGDPRLDWRSGYALGSTSLTRIGLLFPGQAAPVSLRRPLWTDALEVPAFPTQLTGRDADTDTALAQPVIIWHSLAGLAWLDALGCSPVAAVGHSLGEITALHWSGALASTAAVELARVRGRIMARHGAPDTTMASLATSTEHATVLVDGTNAVIAGYNAPDQTVVSGSRHDVEAILERARNAGVRARLLPVSHGFHSPAMRATEQPLADALRRFEIAATGRPVFSTITGGPLGPAADLRALLVTQLTKPVRFSEAVAKLAEHSDLLVETGPGTILSDLVHANGLTTPAVSIDCGGDPRRHAFATATLAACAGADLGAHFANRPFRPLRLDAAPTFVANPCENRRTGTKAGTRSAVPVVTIDKPAATATDDPLLAFTSHLAQALELPAHSIAPESSLLADLHLNSLQMLQAVAEVAKVLGKQLPSTTPLSLTDATVGEVAEVLRGLPGEDATARSDRVAGVRGWVRHFAHRWQRFRSDGIRDVRWAVDAPAGHWLHELAERESVGPEGMAIALTDDAGVVEVAAVLRRIARTQPAHLLIVHYGHPAAVAVARSAAMEPACGSVVVIRPPDETYRIDPSTLADAEGSRYLELRVAGDGGLERAYIRALRPRADTPSYVDAGDVCLVTGGAHGITAYAAAALAERTGCTLVVAGRTPEDDPRVLSALENMRAHGPAHYVPCDITSETEVRRLLDVAWQHGELRGLLHGAGVNEPRRMRDVTAESLRLTLRAKVDGVRTLLDAAGAGLRLVVGFGSIIGAQGLAGQAEYCVSNDWLRVKLERWAAAHPHCRTQVVEWSVWSGIGMGVRLNVLDDLKRHGVEPIAPPQGVEALFTLLADPEAPTTVLTTSRFPSTPTLCVDGARSSLLRFTEVQRAYVPRVEAVAEAELSLGSDPYLDDHRIDGTPVLPAVVGLEAMVQVASLVGADPPWSLTDVTFQAPVTVPPATGRTIQVAALAGAGGIDVVLRDDTDGFRGDRFAGRVEPAPPAPAAAEAAEPPGMPSPSPHPCYAELMFHRGRFQRLVDYDVLSAFRLRAWVRSTDDGWFSSFHSPELMLGDPGALDAALHVLLACVPHRRALPVGADRVSFWHRPSGVLRVVAQELSHTADDFTFDVDLIATDGTVVAGWRGLCLHALGPVTWRKGMPLGLVGPWLSRRLIECDLVDGVELITAKGDRAGTLGVAGKHASTSYASGATLLALSEVPVEVDWKLLPAAPTSTLLAVRDNGDWHTAELLAGKADESLHVSALRMWSARRALAKLGLAQRQPITVDEVTEDGLAVAHTGSVRVVTAACRIQDSGGTIVTAIAADQSE